MKDIINWVGLSKEVTGNRGLIRKNTIPKKYRPLVSDLMAAIKEVLTKHTPK